MTTPTTTINYAMYWHATKWPSDSNRGPTGNPGLLDVDRMTPQQAAASLAKMLRWALVNPTGEMRAIDVDGREDYARQTPLGLTLSARALGLQNVDDLYGLFSLYSDDVKAAPPADVRTVLSDVFSKLVESHPLANHADLGTVAAAITGDLHQRYALIPKD